MFLLFLKNLLKTLIYIMKEIKLSFPYPSTSRHNLSQDVATSLSMGVLVPVRCIEVLPGDSHRIATSYSLISNPLVKPLLQGVMMRYCRFWVPSRIYHIDRRANNSNFDPRTAVVRTGVVADLNFPLVGGTSHSNFQQSSLLDYLSLANVESSYVLLDDSNPTSAAGAPAVHFNIEPYLGYVDIARNYFADSATNMVAFMSGYNVTGGLSNRIGVCVAPLTQLDAYIDNVQNSRNTVAPYDWTKTNYVTPAANDFKPFIVQPGAVNKNLSPDFIKPSSFSYGFSAKQFGRHHVGLCVPRVRPDRFSTLFDTRPLTTQNAVVSSTEVSIGNLSFLSKLQRYLTRVFFGGSRYTDLMYSVFGQRVPHVDSPVLLDVFDTEIGSELVASTNATESSNPGVLGGYFSSSGRLSTGRGSYRKRYTFNEHGYIMDLVYIMPRLFRTSYIPDFYPLAGGVTFDKDSQMAQGNFIPDFNGIGWQQPAFCSYFKRITRPTTDGDFVATTAIAAFCEPSWQQYRTLPDVCHGLMNPLRSSSIGENFGPSAGSSAVGVNSPLFTFNDRMISFNVFRGFTDSDVSVVSRYLMGQFCFVDPNSLNSVFGINVLTFDNIEVVFRYSHQAKRQVTKRFTLNFN